MDEPPWTRRTEILVGRTKCEGLGQETGNGKTDEIHETEKGGCESTKRLTGNEEQGKTSRGKNKENGSIVTQLSS